jgi:hypothetical protein
VVRASTERALPFEIAKFLDFRTGDEAEETAVATHECDELWLWTDRSFPLSFRVGDDVVDGGHGNIESVAGEPGHLRHRILGRLQNYPHAVLCEKALFLSDKERPVESAGKDVHRNFGKRFCGGRSR